MLKHADIWRAVDSLAEANDLSPSGLARASGLDPTTFNRSKRTTRDGRPRWPSTESIAKILEATGSTLPDFATYMDGGTGRGAAQTIPLIGCVQAGSEGYFDDAGFPIGAGWDVIRFPDVGDPNAYAVEVSGDSMEPLYRDGDRLIVSPGSSYRKGDRVVAKTQKGEVLVKELSRLTANRIVLHSLNPAYEDRTLELADVEWVARVVWASQ